MEYVKQLAQRYDVTETEIITSFIKELSNPNFQLSYTPWRHGGSYTNVRYPSGAVGCISSARHTISGKFQISCDEREGEHLYKTRTEAAHAERRIVLTKWQKLYEEVQK